MKQALGKNGEFKKMKRIICLTLALLMLALPLVSCDKDEPPAFEDIDLSTLDSLDDVTTTEDETDYVLITVKNYGQILIRLFPDVAPETVANFKKLVSEDFYDGLIFHRVIENFMIQGGDPDGNGTGGSPDKIKGEFTNNGFENNLKHVRGVVSMARRGDDMDSASSQFFICQKAYAYGDGDYAAFGFAAYGMDVVDKIAKVRTNASDKPYVNVVMESVEFAKVD